MISSEITPFAKTGGLADVVETLSSALTGLGNEVFLIMPAYRRVLAGNASLRETAIKFSVPIAQRYETASVLTTRIGQYSSVYFVRSDKYFDREFLYGTAQADYPDNLERYTFFCRSALEILRRMPVAIIHCHDWQAALTAVFLKVQSGHYGELASAKTVFTIHNLAFQGIFWRPDWPILGLPEHLYTPQYLEFYSNFNLLKGALVFADKITTVSPTYASEIMTPEQGYGLDGVLRERKGDVAGILNGVDYNHWNPAVDPWIVEQYTEQDLTGKKRCKEALQRSLKLPVNERVPVIGMISRLTTQKGFDLVETIFDRLMERELQLVLLGSGEQHYQEFFNLAANRFSKQVAVRIGFDETLAHQIEAGADIFLMPSHYEPCGLNQMFSLKYGTIPIVRSVGGLRDTVVDYSPEKAAGTGFVFSAYEGDALLSAIDRALRTFSDKPAWSALEQRAMGMDFSWSRSAQQYSNLYRELFE